MKIIKSICILWAISVAVVQGQGVSFQQNMSWEEIKHKARIERKYIMLDAFTTWCGPCAEMSAKTFPDKVAGDYFNQNFISVKVQMDRTNNDNSFVRKWYTDVVKINTYMIEAYPTVLYFDSLGGIIGRSVGFKDAESLVKEAKLTVSNCSKFSGMQRELTAGKNDSSFLKNFSYTAREMGREEIAHDVAQRFINTLSEKELFKEHNLGFAYEFTTSSKDRCFQVFRKQSQRVNAIFESKTGAERKVRSIIFKEEIEPYLNTPSGPNWTAIEMGVKKYGCFGLETYYGERMNYHWLKQNNWKEFAKYYALYFKTSYSRSKFNINNASWFVFLHVDDRTVLNLAVKTMMYNNEHFDANDPMAWDTYANLLYKVGRTKQAIEAQKKAITLETSLANSQNRKPKSTYMQTLDKMEAGERTWPIN